MDKFTEEELYWLRKVLNDELGDEIIPDDVADTTYDAHPVGRTQSVA
ncbi:hypothetical protein SAMN05660284_00336 [Formivibrio citricus]|uniref:Uncharacterized protein n=1 Tax=Formivibrio citricus TaxID=83765 RepID=A0A1I4VR54_9NEIS|nr:hypothetical protein [Formivibrio citricus]SFN03660.1 hypothetical protein SAMN05660284_00336 [Formivibrio citricus]